MQHGNLLPRHNNKITDFLDIIQCSVFYLKFYFKTEKKNRLIVNVQKVNNCTNIPSSQTLYSQTLSDKVELNSLSWSYKVANGVTEIRPQTSVQKIKYLEQALKATHPHTYLDSWV
jgi:hypothetical protein